MLSPGKFIYTIIEHIMQALLKFIIIRGLKIISKAGAFCAGKDWYTESYGFTAQGRNKIEFSGR